MPIILFSSKNTASANIAKHLLEKSFERISENEWQFQNIRVIDTCVEIILDVPTNFNTDYLVVLSPHKSKEGKPMLTAHFPGNWDDAVFGGRPRTLNIAYGAKLAALINEINKQAEAKSIGSEFQVVLEVDHHGPTCEVPIIFVEIGSTEKEWENKLAGEVIANAVINVVIDNKTKTQNIKPKTVFGIGGGHYAREFTKAILRSDFYVGHMLPKYKINSLAEDTFKQALERNVEKIDEVVVLKESLNTSQKRMIKGLCEKFDVRYTEYKVE